MTTFLWSAKQNYTTKGLHALLFMQLVINFLHCTQSILSDSSHSLVIEKNNGKSDRLLKYKRWRHCYNLRWEQFMSCCKNYHVQSSAPRQGPGRTLPVDQVVCHHEYRPRLRKGLVPRLRPRGGSSCMHAERILAFVIIPPPQPHK